MAFTRIRKQKQEPTCHEEIVIKNSVYNYSTITNIRIKYYTTKYYVLRVACLEYCSSVV